MRSRPYLIPRVQTVPRSETGRQKSRAKGLLEGDQKYVGSAVENLHLQYLLDDLGMYGSKLALVLF